MSENLFPHCSISSVDRDINKNRIFCSAEKQQNENMEIILFANFNVSIMSRRNLKMLVKTLYRTALSHLWMEIFSNFAYLFLQESSRKKT